MCTMLKEGFRPFWSDRLLMTCLTWYREPDSSPVQALLTAEQSLQPYTYIKHQFLMVLKQEYFNFLLYGP